MPDTTAARAALAAALEAARQAQDQVCIEVAQAAREDANGSHAATEAELAVIAGVQAMERALAEYDLASLPAGVTRLWPR